MTNTVRLDSSYHTPSTAARPAPEADEPLEALDAREAPETVRESHEHFEMSSAAKEAMSANPALFVNPASSANSTASGFDTTSKPTDKSSLFTRRLVGARVQFEVRQVVSDASSELLPLRMIAAIGKDEDASTARACIQKLEKLMNRAYKKIKDLDHEDILSSRRKQAEKKKQMERAEQIKEELRRQQMIRRAKENCYLLDELNDLLLGGKPRSAQDPSAKMDAATEAAITAQAEAMAAAEAIAGSGGAETGGGAPEAAAPAMAATDMPAAEPAATEVAAE